MFDKRCRPGVERGLAPVGSTLRRAGISADQLTVLGLLLSAASALAIARGWLVAGAMLLAASAIPDVLDGAVAKASGTASPRGAFFDSVIDRVSDNLVLGGVAWYLASADGGHAAVLPLAVLAASNLVSYERARAESLGFSARGGLMERAERMMAVGLGLLFSPALVPILWVMLVLTVVTAVHRFAMVWRQGSLPRTADTSRLRVRWRTLSQDREREREPGRWRPRRRSGARPAGRRRERTRPPRS